jgi:hypothetical protein
MSFSGKWLEPEIIILSKISQTQKYKYHMFLSYEGSSSINANKQKYMNLNRGWFGGRGTEGMARGTQKWIWGMNTTQENCVHVWKYHNETKTFEIKKIFSW